MTPTNAQSPSRSRSLRRTIATIIRLTLLGALTTPAVAWIGACFPAQSPKMIAQNYPRFDGEAYMVAMSTLSPCMSIVFWRCEPEALGYSQVKVGDQGRPAPHWSTIWSSELRRASAASGRWPDDAHGFDLASGWPLLSMVGTSSAGTAGPNGRWHRIGTMLIGPNRVWTVSPGRAMGQGRKIPLTPMWPGFLADTVLYGLVWWVFLLALAAWIRRRRRRAGLCVHCRYDLRATPPGLPCPECGTLIKTSSRPPDPSRSPRP